MVYEYGNGSSEPSYLPYRKHKIKKTHLLPGALQFSINKITNAFNDTTPASSGTFAYRFLLTKHLKRDHLFYQYGP